MKIAILSDIHDHIWNLEKVIDQITGEVDAVIYCGDFCSPFVPPYLAGLSVPVYACLGNNDEDQIGLSQNAGDQFTWIPLFKEFGDIDLDGKRIVFCHYPKLGELLAKSGEYDAVFHGHNHVAKVEQHGTTVFANPGAVCGIQKGKSGTASYALYTTQDNAVTLVTIE